MGARIFGAFLLAGAIAGALWFALREARSPAAVAPEIVREAETQPAGERAEEARPERAPRAAATEPPALAPELEPTHRVVGRVVDERRAPVAGARVRFGALAEAASGADGRFELLLHTPKNAGIESNVLLAREGGRAAAREVWIPEADSASALPLEVDGGTLVLGEAFDLRVRARGADGPAAGAELQVALGHLRMPLGGFRADEDGALLLEALPRGPVHIVATLPGREGHARAFVPEERELVVELLPLGAAEVEVVDAESGAGVAEAVLSVRRYERVPMALPGEERRTMSGEYVTQAAAPCDGARTDASGRARLEGLVPGLRYTVGASAPGYALFPRPPASGVRVEAGGEPARIELQPLALRTVRFPVVAGELPPPPEGAEIALRPRPGSYGRGQEPPPMPPGRMEGKTLIVDGVSGYASFIAQAPDGALAQLWCREGEELGAETSFRRPRRIEVLVRDADGAPVPGAQAIARNQGNNDLCEWVAADEQGVAWIEGLHGELAEVHVRAPGDAGWGTKAGSVDLDAGDGRVEATLERSETVRARLTLLVDGAPRCPSRFSLRARSGRVDVVEERPERGELLLELPAATPLEAWFSADGFASALIEFDARAGGGEPRATLALERTTVLVARVTPPEEGYMDIKPQRHDPAAGGWSTPRELGLFNGLHYANGPGGSFVFSGLRPGRWRVLDERSGAASDAVEVREGEREVELALDLSSVGWASGRVECADPAELARARVLVLDSGAESTVAWQPGRTPPEGAAVLDGAFRVQVPGDREVRLVVWHPWLAPDPEAGSITLRGAREGLVLRLVPGDELRLPVPQLSGRHVRVARYAGEPAGAPLAWHHAPIVGGLARCGLPAGTWTLWIDAEEDYAPLVLREVAIDGPTQLPPAAFERGSSIRVSVLVPQGEAPPRLYVVAHRLGEPAYYRSLNSEGEAEVLLPGLGPGRFQVEYRPIMGFERGLETELELDGAIDATLELDLR